MLIIAELYVTDDIEQGRILDEMRMVRIKTETESEKIRDGSLNDLVI